MKSVPSPFGRNPMTVNNEKDGRGNPAGGYVDSKGLSIHWQEGPLGRPAGEPNGAFVEDVILAAKQRLEFYQEGGPGVGRFACRENAVAITKLDEALLWLYKRRMDREARGVQGLNEP